MDKTLRNLLLITGVGIVICILAFGISGAMELGAETGVTTEVGNRLGESLTSLLT